MIVRSKLNVILIIESLKGVIFLWSNFQTGLNVQHRTLTPCFCDFEPTSVWQPGGLTHWHTMKMVSFSIKINTTIVISPYRYNADICILSTRVSNGSPARKLRRTLEIDPTSTTLGRCRIYCQPTPYLLIGEAFGTRGPWSYCRFQINI